MVNSSTKAAVLTTPTVGGKHSSSVVWPRLVFQTSAPLAMSDAYSKPLNEPQKTRPRSGATMGWEKTSAHGGSPTAAAWVDQFSLRLAAVEALRAVSSAL